MRWAGHDIFEDLVRNFCFIHTPHLQLSIFSDLQEGR